MPTTSPCALRRKEVRAQARAEELSTRERVREEKKEKERGARRRRRIALSIARKAGLSPKKQKKPKGVSCRRTTSSQVWVVDPVGTLRKPDLSANDKSRSMVDTWVLISSKELVVRWTRTRDLSHFMVVYQPRDVTANQLAAVEKISTSLKNRGVKFSNSWQLK